MRAALKAVLPKFLRRFYRRYFPYQPPRLAYSSLGDLEKISLLRTAPLAALQDAAALEALIPQLGLNDEAGHEFPAQLQPYCGQGLRVWQYPSQLAPYLVRLSTLRIRSYLEVGIRHGGMFVTTVEYLARFQPLRLAAGVDLCASPTLEAYAGMRPEVQMHLLDSHSPAFQDLVRHGGFDAALIDGDHTEKGCWQDWMAVHGQVPVIVLHDIASDSCLGVVRAWRRIRKQFAADYAFEEYTAQYPEVRQRTGEQYLGLGVAIAKTWLARAEA